MAWLIVLVVYLYIAVAFLRCEWFMVSPPNPPGKLRRKFIVAEYDMWIGCYLDRKNKTAYWFPIPFVGLKWWRPSAASEGGSNG